MQAKIASPALAQAMQSTQQAKGMFSKQEAGLMKLASIIRTVSAPLATDALGVLAC